MILSDTMLSAREREVAVLLGEGVTVTEVAVHLKLSVKTVSTYRARILDKLALPTTAALMRFVIERSVRASIANGVAA